MSNAALIVAAGNGSRFGGGRPKQYVDLAGLPVIRRTVMAFLAAPEIDRIRLVDSAVDLVRDVAIGGADRPYLSALIFPDPALLRQLCGADAFTPLADLCRHPKVLAHFKAELEKLAQQSTGSSTLIRRAILMDKPPEMDKGEATDKGTINQRAIIANRADSVDEIYAGSDRVIEIAR